ncbi:MAG: glutamine-hydrolyzing carbamoyl-phosphate synthase small subunit [Planctomycetes bacterium]|nr:glutamine-hydrolyzing carbamoyl-phosphate synthase small subunit [Planctomycetota bacterium]
MGNEHSPAILVLEDGTAYYGQSVGASGERAFELVFNTSMTGYQEILTDPSYAGQGVVMTYPQIGNYGVCLEDDESDRCWADAMIMREMSPLASNYRAEMTLGAYLQQRDVLGIEGIDTRDLTLKLRDQGALRAVLSTEFFDVAALTEMAKGHPSLEGRDLAANVTCKSSYQWDESLPGFGKPGADSPHLVCFDFGVKRNILRCLVACGFRVTVVPASTSAADVLALQPDALFLSNGPGDPAAVTYAHESVRTLVEGGLATFGICLGHQILAHAFGAKTYKMKFGHHGANHPVVESNVGKIDITTQNHSFAVDIDSLKKSGLVTTHVNGNDGTLAGMEHSSLPVFSVQYHPEAAPGPHDSQHLFQRFFHLVQANKKPVA